jgi:hypothetical protein
MKNLFTTMSKLKTLFWINTRAQSNLVRTQTSNLLNFAGPHWLIPFDPQLILALQPLWSMERFSIERTTPSQSPSMPLVRVCFV